KPWSSARSAACRERVGHPAPSPRRRSEFGGPGFGAPTPKRGNPKRAQSGRAAHGSLNDGVSRAHDYRPRGVHARTNRGGGTKPPSHHRFEFSGSCASPLPFSPVDGPLGARRAGRCFVFVFVARLPRFALRSLSWASKARFMSSVRLPELLVVSDGFVLEGSSAGFVSDAVVVEPVFVVLVLAYEDVVVLDLNVAVGTGAAAAGSGVGGWSRREIANPRPPMMAAAETTTTASVLRLPRLSVASGSISALS